MMEGFGTECLRHRVSADGNEMPVAGLEGHRDFLACSHQSFNPIDALGIQSPLKRKHAFILLRTVSVIIHYDHLNHNLKSTKPYFLCEIRASQELACYAIGTM